MSSPANEIGAGARLERDLGSAAGSNGSLRGQVAQLQCARLVPAAIEVSCEHGLEQASVSRIVACASCLRRTFYEHFGDKHACFLAALEVASNQAVSHATPSTTASAGGPTSSERACVLCSSASTASRSSRDSAGWCVHERTTRPAVASPAPPRAQRRGMDCPAPRSLTSCNLLSIALASPLRGCIMPVNGRSVPL